MNSEASCGCFCEKKSHPVAIDDLLQSNKRHQHCDEHDNTVHDLSLIHIFAAAAGDRFDAEKNVGLYVDHTIGVDDTTGKLLVGNVQKEKATGTVGIADNSVVVIDTKKFGAEDTVFDATLSISKAAPVILSGLTTNTSFILATETDNATTPNIKLVDNTVFFDGKLTKAENGNLVLNTVFNDKVTDDAELNDVIKTQLDGSHNQKNADVLAAIADTTKKAGLVNKEGTALTDKGDVYKRQSRKAPCGGIYQNM